MTDRLPSTETAENLSVCSVTGQPVVADSSLSPFAADLGLSSLREYDVCGDCGSHLHPDASVPCDAPEDVNPYCPPCSEQREVFPGPLAAGKTARAFTEPHGRRP